MTLLANAPTPPFFLYPIFHLLALVAFVLLARRATDEPPKNLGLGFAVFAARRVLLDMIEIYQGQISHRPVPSVLFVHFLLQVAIAALAMVLFVKAARVKEPTYVRPLAVAMSVVLTGSIFRYADGALCVVHVLCREGRFDPFTRNIGNVSGLLAAFALVILMIGIIRARALPSRLLLLGLATYVAAAAVSPFLEVLSHVGWWVVPTQPLVALVLYVLAFLLAAATVATSAKWTGTLLLGAGMMALTFLPVWGSIGNVAACGIGGPVPARCYPKPPPSNNPDSGFRPTPIYSCAAPLGTRSDTCLLIQPTGSATP